MQSSARDIQFTSAISDEEDAHDAIHEVLAAATETMGPEPVDLAIAFISYHHRAAAASIAADIASALEPRVSLGVTAGGVLGSGFELENRPGIALLTARLGGAWFQPFTYQQLQWSSQTDAQQLRAALLGPHADAQDIAAVILLADPFSTPAMHLIPAINEALPRVPVIGGMASGASDAGENRLFLGEQILSDGAVGVVIGGQVRVDCIVSQGCRPIGDRWVITKARQNIIQDLGQRPAMTAIQSTAQQVSHEDRNLLEEHGILLGRVINEYKERFGRGDFLIRNIIGADPDAGYIAVSDFVRVGQTVQFHVRDARTAEEDLKLLLESEKLDAQAAGALLFTCNGRGSRLFEEPNFESTIIRQALGDVPLAGFFAAGEIGPIAGENFIHGFTASLVLFRKV
jgi:small ligand-binding sensory domain FIST